MILDSFKSIILRKAEGNNGLYSLISNLDEETLVDSVVDALEKMAKPTQLTGVNANGPITSFGANLDKTDTTQLRDALGHHLSHYKAALKEHHAAPEGPVKTHMRQVADKHLEHVIPLMHLAARAAAHSNGKLSIDYPPLAPWETNYTTLQTAKTGKNRLLRDPKLLRVRPSKTSKRTDPNSTAIPDYHYLEMPPHPGHDAVSKMPHTGGYPWEEIQVGSPADIDAKKAYLHIEDVPDKKEYTPHEFDQHPIRSIADVQAAHLTPEAMQSFADSSSNWRSSEPHKQWLEGQKAKFTADKEGYMKRGQSKGSHFYEGIPLQEQPAHVRTVPAKPKYQAETEETPIAQVQPSAAPVSSAAAAPISTSSAIAPTIKRPSPQVVPQSAPQVVRPTAAQPTQPATPSIKENDLENMYKFWSTLPPKHQNEMLRSLPFLKNYVMTKKGGK